MDSLQILLTKSRMARFVFCCLVASILVASHLANALPQELVVGSACQLEAITADGLIDEKRVDECNRCWPRLALEDRASTEAAKEQTFSTASSPQSTSPTQPSTEMAS